MVPRWYPDGTPMVPRWYPDGTPMVPRWYPDGTPMVVSYTIPDGDTPLSVVYLTDT